MLGRYRLARRIAVGGMAEIYLARTESIEGFEKLAVVKRILPQFARDKNFLRMFLDEARLAATLEHPNIVAVYDIGEQDGEYFFTMEYVHGQSLREVMRAASLRRQWIPLEHSLAIVIAVCAALHHAHEKVGHDGQPIKIVHRDVSPSNVLITYDGGVKLTDFGIAKATTVSERTAAGTLKGKIPYMSPEQCRAEPLDRRSDICALGVLLYELTVGRRPYQAKNDVALLSVVARGEAPPPSAIWRAYPKDLERIVMNAMARDRNYRCPTARALQMDLEEFARLYRIPLSTARLAHYMEYLFDAEVRRWPTNVEESAEEPTSAFVQPGAMPRQQGAQRPRMPRRPATPVGVQREGSGTVANPNMLADIAAMDAALTRVTANNSSAEDATEELGGPDPDRDSDW